MKIFDHAHDCPRPVRSILVIRLDGIGDMILTTPFLREARAAFPHARITLVVQDNPAIVNLMETGPYINRLVAAPPLLHGRFQRLRSLPVFRRFCHMHLSNESYDIAIFPRVAPSDYRYFEIAFFSHASVRVAHRSTIPDRSGYQLGLTHVFGTEIPSGKHSVDAALSLLNEFGHTACTSTLELWPTTADCSNAEALRATVDSSKLICAIAPGASMPKKCWPAGYFASLIKRLHDDGIATCLLGAKEDEGLCRSIAMEDSLILAGVPPREVHAFLPYCRLFIVNDSGPAHLAAAAKVPSVIIGTYPSHDGWNAPVRFLPQHNRYFFFGPDGFSTSESTSMTFSARQSIVDVDTVYRAASLLVASRSPEHDLKGCGPS